MQHLITENMINIFKLPFNYCARLNEAVEVVWASD